MRIKYHMLYNRLYINIYMYYFPFVYAYRCIHFFPKIKFHFRESDEKFNRDLTSFTLALLTLSHCDYGTLNRRDPDRSKFRERVHASMIVHPCTIIDLSGSTGCRLLGSSQGESEGTFQKIAREREKDQHTYTSDILYLWL